MPFSKVFFFFFIFCPGISLCLLILCWVTCTVILLVTLHQRVVKCRLPALRPEFECSCTCIVCFSATLARLSSCASAVTCWLLGGSPILIHLYTSLLWNIALFTLDRAACKSKYIGTCAAVGLCESLLHACRQASLLKPLCNTMLSIVSDFIQLSFWVQLCERTGYS